MPRRYRFYVVFEILILLALLAGWLVWSGRWRSWTRSTIRRELPLALPWFGLGLALFTIVAPRGLLNRLTGLPFPREQWEPVTYVVVALMLLGTLVGTTGLPKLATPPWYRKMEQTGFDPRPALLRAASRHLPDVDERVVLLTSRRRLLAYGIFSLLIAAGLVWALRNDLAQGDVFGTVLTGVGAVIVTWLGITQLAAIFRRGRSLTLDERGIRDRTGIFYKAWARRWEEIKEVFLYDDNGSIMLAVVPRDPRAVRGSHWWSTTAPGAAGSVPLNQFTRPEAEVLAIILAFCRRHRVPVREPEPDD